MVCHLYHVLCGFFRQQGTSGHPRAQHPPAAHSRTPALYRGALLPAGWPPGGRGGRARGGHAAVAQLLQGMGKGSVYCAGS